MTTDKEDIHIAGSFLLWAIARAGSHVYAVLILNIGRTTSSSVPPPHTTTGTRPLAISNATEIATKTLPTSLNRVPPPNGRYRSQSGPASTWPASASAARPQSQLESQDRFATSRAIPRPADGPTRLASKPSFSLFNDSQTHSIDSFLTYHLAPFGPRNKFPPCTATSVEPARAPPENPVSTCPTPPSAPTGTTRAACKTSRSSCHH